MEGKKETTTTTNAMFQTFYYNWYGNVERDKAWFHWDQPVLDDSKRVPVPENDDIGSTSWPEMGMYSSSDPTVLAQHCRQMADSGIGVAIVSWYGPLRADQKEDLFAGFQDRTVPLLLEAAANAGIRVAFHHEPYPGRTADTVLSDLEYIHSKYASHPGCYLHDGPRGKLPLVYIYDSYLVDRWAHALSKNKVAYTVGLVVEEKHLQSLLISGFDGVYSYFASDGFVWGSSVGNWPKISSFCHEHGLLWIPCAGPGYNDEKVRPWNKKNTKDREGGAYLRRMLQRAVSSSASLVGLTSFNEWHEGTQLEPAIPKSGYLSYSPLPPDGYLHIVREFSRK